MSTGNALSQEGLAGLHRNLVGFLRTNRHHDPQFVGDDPSGAASGKKCPVSYSEDQDGVQALFLCSFVLNSGGDIQVQFGKNGAL